MTDTKLATTLPMPLALEVIWRFGMLCVLLQLEFSLGRILDKAPQTISFYYLSTAFAVGILLAALVWGTFALARDIQELCFYDVLVQVAGLILFAHGASTTSVTVETAGNVVYLAKVIRLFWPISFHSNGAVRGWPVFGLLGVFRRSESGDAPTIWHQRPAVIYAALLLTLPAGYGMLILVRTYHITLVTWLLVLVCTFGLRPLINRLRQMDNERTQALADKEAALRQLAETEAAHRIELQAQNDALAKSNAERAELIEQLRVTNERILHAHHDAMQPMFWLNTLLRSARAQASTPEQINRAEQTLATAAEVTTTLRDVFAQVRADINQVPMTTTVLNTASLGQSIWDRFYELANRHRVNLAMSDRPLRVATNELRLRRIISNLLTNAIVHGGENSRVSLSFCRRGANVWMFVRSNGQSILDANAPDRAANVAAVMARAQSELDSPNPPEKPLGHGIGLPSTERLAQDIGSKLLLRARPGAGVVFCLALVAA